MIINLWNTYGAARRAAGKASRNRWSLASVSYYVFLLKLWNSMGALSLGWARERGRKGRLIATRPHVFTFLRAYSSSSCSGGRNLSVRDITLSMIDRIFRGVFLSPTPKWFGSVNFSPAVKMLTFERLSILRARVLFLKIFGNFPITMIAFRAEFTFDWSFSLNVTGNLKFENIFNSYRSLKLFFFLYSRILTVLISSTYVMVNMNIKNLN